MGRVLEVGGGVDNIDEHKDVTERVFCLLERWAEMWHQKLRQPIRLHVRPCTNEGQYDQDTQHYGPNEIEAFVKSHAKRDNQ